MLKVLLMILPLFLILLVVGIWGRFSGVALGFLSGRFPGNDGIFFTVWLIVGLSFVMTLLFLWVNLFVYLKGWYIMVLTAEKTCCLTCFDKGGYEHPCLECGGVGRCEECGELLKVDICPTCKGAGEIGLYVGEETQCPECAGTARMCFCDCGDDLLNNDN